MNVLIFMLI